MSSLEVERRLEEMRSDYENTSHSAESNIEQIVAVASKAPLIRAMLKRIKRNLKNIDREAKRLSRICQPMDLTE